MSSKDLLCDYINQGNKVKYICFWGHKKKASGITKSCFSQWYDSPFEVAGIIYKTAEHYMMAKKARLFGDLDTETKIIASNNPGAAKQLGREVRNFDEKIWIQHRFEIVVQANLEKFSQHTELKEFLLNTGEKILVEASPVDKIWGVGLAADDPAVENPNLWQGLNLLGFALMDVREILSRDGEKA
jgi:ribA/ribD-fused uncharacterized protein